MTQARAQASTSTRASSPAPLPPIRRRVARAGAAAAAVLALAGGLLVVGSTSSPPTAGREVGGQALGAQGPAAPVPGSVTALQEQLRRVPGNDRAWAELGAAYVQQVRLAGDPLLYAKADGAFAQSLRLRPEGNDLALAGQAALAAGRHEFARAVQLSDQALAVNAFSSGALATKVDALLELGRYADSRAVLQRLLDLRPGVDAFTRASYALELQGQTRQAADALRRALAVASTPQDRAFVQHYLGELAWNTGDTATAAASYAAALAADPAYAPSLAGRGRVRAAAGDLDRALADYRTALSRAPQPDVLLELGELLQSRGRTTEAQEQYGVLRATQQLYAASGQVVDVELALFEADHGDPVRAVELAEKAYAARPRSIVALDAYAWALHAAGRHAQALPRARAAVRTGLPSASLAYHLGTIEAAAGNAPAARRSLTRALELNPAWSPLHAARARALLDRLP